MNRRVTAIVVVVVVAAIVPVASLATALTTVKSAYHVINGIGSASDGRLKITLNNYHYDVGSDILFQTGGSSVNVSTTTVPAGYAYGSSGYGLYVLLNVTFQNLGDGPAPIGPGFAAIGNGLLSYSNGELMTSASFPGEFPSTSLGSNGVWGGQNLPGGSSLTVWLIFGLNGIGLGQAT